MIIQSTIGAPGLLAAALLIAAVACGGDGRQGSRPADAMKGPVGNAAAEVVVPVARGRTIVVNGIDLTSIGYDKGSAAAPIVVVEFSDFGCPYCREFARETFPAIDNEFIRTGKVFFKYVPFVIGMFPNATEAARAAECAGEQNKFWALYDRLFLAQSEWKREASPGALFARYAGGAGLDQARFASCYARDTTHPATARASEAARELGVRVTPSFIVNGRPVEGALPLADFRQLLTQQAK